ncbi:14975_t:CDS:2 [Gigaspora margarita]|uniref:14975_t:CDS:1 n=1 Tax=Gigaspora margarita TaxID=4874 RepID=A0ABN7UXI1_GIGMA|nr:14975_t:CDS:2 [Gigaspora margarita]
MPKRSKRARQSLKAIRKRWKQAKNSDEELESGPVEELESRIVEELEPEPVEYEEPSDAEPDEYDECFSTFWIEGEENRFDSEEIMDQLQGLQQNILEQLVENAKTNIWATSSRGPIYRGNAESTLRNKRVYWKKAASGSKKISDMFSLKNVEAPESHMENYDFTFDDTYDSSDDDDSKFTLESLDLLLKNKSDDLRLRTVSQYLHLVQDRGFGKMDASGFLSQSLGKGPWHARLIRSWTNQWLNKGEIVTSKRGRHAKIRSLLLHEDFKLRVTEYLRLLNFVKFIEDEVIPALGIEEKTTISHTTAREWLHKLGWQYKDHSKNIYFDGHEREDVVAYRREFLRKLAELRRRMATYEGENLDQIIPPLLLPEIDGVVKAWGPEDESQLRSKSQGLSLHVSDFICESIGRLQLSEEECAINDSLPDDKRLVHTEACVIMYPGTNRDGWWTSK